MATSVRFFEVIDRNGDVLYHSRFSNQRPHKCPARRFPERRSQPQEVSVKPQETEGSLAEVLFIIIMLAVITLVW